MRANTSGGIAANSGAPFGTRATANARHAAVAATTAANTFRRAWCRRAAADGTVTPGTAANSAASDAVKSAASLRVSATACRRAGSAASSASTALRSSGVKPGSSRA